MPEKIRGIRKKAGLLQREMAEKIGVDLRTYCRWELGEILIPEPEYRLLVTLFPQQ